MQHGDNKWIEEAWNESRFQRCICDGPFSWGVARLRRAADE
jgi:hypothetical protein